jgi:tetratricopeptide (TPR) repeat protein
MRYIKLIGFLLFLSLAPNIEARGQDNSDPIVYITTFDEIPDQNEAAFLAVVETQLNQYGVEVQLSEDETAQIGISLGEDYFAFWLASARDSITSPIIYSNTTIPHCGDLTGGGVPERYQLTAASHSLLQQLVVALGLYQAGLYGDSYTLLYELEAELMLFYYFPSFSFREYWNFYQANNLIMIGDFDAAITLLEETIFDPENSNPGRTHVTNLAWLYIHIGKTDEALTLLKDYLPTVCSSITLDENNPYIHLGQLETLARRAQLYALAFDYDSAIADMDAAIDLAEAHEVSDEQLAELYTLRGEIIFLIYEWDRVLENFNTALKLNPDYAPAYFQRGVLYYTMTEPENALADFQHYLELASDGEYATEAQRYIDSIQLELESLGG